MAANKKCITYLVVFTGLLVSVISGFVLRGRAVEQWYVWKLRSADLSERERALNRLTDTGSVRGLAVALMNESEQIRVSAAEALGGMGPDAGAAVPALLRALKDSLAMDPPAGISRLPVCHALASIGEPAASILVEALKDDDAEVRAHAAFVLGRRVPTKQSVISALIGSLSDEGRQVRLSAADSLGEIGDAARSAVPRLVEALGDEWEGVRQHAAVALGKMGPAAESAVPALVEALEDRDEMVRVHAARALGLVGRPAREAVPALIAMLNHKNQAVRQAASGALKQVEDPAVRSRLRAFMRKRYGSFANPGDKLRVLFEGERLAVPEHCYVDIEYGSIARLSFLRCRVTPDRVRAETVTWRGRWFSRSEVSGEVHTAQVDRRRFERVLDALRILPTIVLREEKAPSALSGLSVSCSSFFVLIRVLDENKSPVLERRYAGGMSSVSQLDYLPVLAVFHLARDIVEEGAHWQAVPVEGWRASHFTEAFVLNRECMMDRSYGFAMENSVEALALFGNGEAAETLKSLLSRADLLNRQREKINELLESGKHRFRKRADTAGRDR